MQRFTLLAATLGAAVALALPAAAKAPASGWIAGTGAGAASFTVLHATADGQAVAGGLDGALAVTADHGRTWRSLTPPTSAQIRDVRRLGARTLAALADDGALYRSRDDGASWTRLALPNATRPMALAAPGGERLLVVGHRALLWSNDGGDQFRSVAPRLVRGDAFSGVDMVGRRGVLAWGGHALLASYDSGVHWSHMRLPHLARGDSLLAVDFTSARTGYVLTSFRRFFRTTNAGHHWGEMLGTAGAGADVAFDGSEGWLAAPGFANRFDGYVLHSTDGGVTWRPQAVADSYLSHVSTGRGWTYAIGNQGASLFVWSGREGGRAITVGFRPVPRVAKRGGTVRIRGRVNPALRGVGVAVSMRSQGRWIVRWVHTNARGVFVARFKLQKTAAFVAQVPAVDGHGSAGTPPVSVPVSR